MSRLFVTLAVLLFMTGAKSPLKTPRWQHLFNGKDLTHWRVKIRGHALDENFGNTFRVVDGNLTVNYDQYGTFDEQFGHIFYDQKFSSYLLSMEYRFVGEQAREGPGWAYRNSGAMIHSQAPETMGLEQDFPISIEVQLLGGNGTDPRPTANLCTPGTEVYLNGKLFTDHCVNSTSRTYHGDQWVTVDVLVIGSQQITHIVNGDTVLRYERPQIGGGVVSGFDPKVKIDGTVLQDGYISLQSESHPIQFKRVDLVDLSPYMGDPRKLQKVVDLLRKR